MEKFENNLIHEKSPYLLQHANNPVNWYPWGREALEKAKTENKLILLSIGYSTCHWCHVMEKESFESEEVAQILNQNFVSIKVDREERPDIDNLYMGLAQALGVGGGWPLNLFLTPDKVPFTGGTYFPLEDAYGKRSFKFVLSAIAEMWKSDPENILNTQKGVLNYVQQGNSPVAVPIDVNELHKKAVQEKAAMYEPGYGGFSSAPKFPMGHVLSYLILQEQKEPEKLNRNRIVHTLDNMAGAGLYDQIGGGFHRYSTDREWLVPHFEKMLYDQALLIMAFLDGYQLTSNKRYAEIAAETIGYLGRDMLDAQGGFYSAEDADSEGEEGTFYLWDMEELRELFPDSPGLIMDWFGASARGNFEGKNILTRKHSLEWLADKYNKDFESIKYEMEKIYLKLLNKRSERIRPHLDDKILTDWNGLIISALSQASWKLPKGKIGDIDRARCLSLAKNAADFVLEKLRDNELRFLKSYRKGPSSLRGFIEDYAFMANGLLDLYEASLDVNYLKEAVFSASEMIKYFWDAELGGFFFIANDGEKLLKNAKELNDGAIPSGNSVAALACARLYRITGEESYKNIMEKMIPFFSSQLKTYPSSYPVFLAALDMYLNPGPEIIISGNREDSDFQTMLDYVYEAPILNRILLHVPANMENPEIFELSPFTKNQVAIGGKTTFYFCENRSCQRPLTSSTEVKRFLESL